MRQEFGRTVESSFSPLSDSHPKLLGVPIDDDGGQQVQTRDAEVLNRRGVKTARGGVRCPTTVKNIQDRVDV